MLHEREFAPFCRRAAGRRRPGVHCARRRGRGESRRVSPGALGGRRRPRGAAALRRARRLDSAARRRARRGRAGRGRRRHAATSTSRAGSRCQNPGHGFAPVVAAIHEQVDQLPPPVLHGRHLRALRRGVPPARRALAVRGRRPEVDPRELGRRGDRERGQDRARRDRPLRRDRLRQRLPRPHAADDGDDEQGRPYKAGFGPFASEVYRDAPRRIRTAASTRTPRSPRSSICSRARSTRSPSPASCSRPSRARAASSRCRRTSRARLARGLRARTGSSTSTTRCSPGVGRTGPMWAVEHYEGVEPDLVVSGKSLGGGLPLAGGHRARGDHGRARPRRAGRHVRRQPRRLRRGGRRARHRRGAGVPRARGRARREAARPPRRACVRVTSRSARCVGSGRCWRSSSASGVAGSRREDRRPPPSSAACSFSPAACTGT